MRVKIHQVKIDFNVTAEIKRYVFVYIIEGRYCYLIDSGVKGSEQEIIAYLEKIGRKVSDIKGIFLTHAHPDHIGTLFWFKEHTDCKIYASEGEKRWIENVDIQFKERPIPNFYSIAGKSTNVDVIVKDGDVITLEDGVSLEVMRTAGHSADGMSYRIGESMFIGDAIPVKGDIPIIIDGAEQQKTMQRMSNVTGVETFYPAWDTIYTRDIMKEKLQEADKFLSVLKNEVTTLDRGEELSVLVDEVCQKLNMNMLKTNPLFATTIECLRQK